MLPSFGIQVIPYWGIKGNLDQVAKVNQQNSAYGNNQS